AGGSVGTGGGGAKQRVGPGGRITISGGVAEQGGVTGRGIIAAGGIAEQRLVAAGGVLEASGVAAQRGVAKSSILDTAVVDQRVRPARGVAERVTNVVVRWAGPTQGAAQQEEANTHEHTWWAAMHSVLLGRGGRLRGGVSRREGDCALSPCARTSGWHCTVSRR